MLEFFKAVARLINAALDGQVINLKVQINGVDVVLPPATTVV